MEINFKTMKTCNHEILSSINISERSLLSIQDCLITFSVMLSIIYIVIDRSYREKSHMRSHKCFEILERLLTKNRIVPNGINLAHVPAVQSTRFQWHQLLRSFHHGSRTVINEMVWQRRHRSYRRRCYRHSTKWNARIARDIADIALSMPHWKRYPHVQWRNSTEQIIICSDL